jgi:hypothetical protein
MAYHGKRHTPNSGRDSVEGHQIHFAAAGQIYSICEKPEVQAKKKLPTQLGTNKHDEDINQMKASFSYQCPMSPIFKDSSGYLPKSIKLQCACFCIVDNMDSQTKYNSLFGNIRELSYSLFENMILQQSLKVKNKTKHVF